MYEFGDFRLDVAARALLFRGTPVPLSTKGFELLVMLVAHRDRALSKAELMEALWPNVIVEDNNLTVTMSSVRRALGASGQDIETLPRYGYRFRGAVREVPVEGLGAAPVRRTIAVLPLQGLSVGGGSDHLGVGMADTLITRLSSLKQISVRPTSAVLRYAGIGCDPAAAGRELGVDAVLEGTVRRDGNRVRVSVQLVTVLDRRPLWGARFDEQFTNIFAVEDAIAERVAAALTLQLTTTERRLLTKRPTANAEAYQLCLHGRYVFSHQTEEGVRRAIDYYLRAIEQDSTYALAYAWLAAAYTWLSHFYVAPREAMPNAHAAAIRAVALDDTLAEAHTALGLVLLWYEWDFAGANRELSRALVLNPADAVARMWRAFLLTALRQFDDAAREASLAIVHEPLNNFVNSGVGFPFYYARCYDRAGDYAARMLELEPNSWVGHWLRALVELEGGRYACAIASIDRAIAESRGSAHMMAVRGYIHAVAGQHDDARRILAELGIASQRRYVSSCYLAAIHSALGDGDSAIELLERAFDERSEWLVWAGVEPRFQSLRSDARFQGLLRRVGLTG